eukprot:COSAG01_NODE_25936_length_728_cov_3.292528_1_plen_72_part_10
MWKRLLTFSAVFCSEVFLRLGTRFCQLSYLRIIVGGAPAPVVSTPACQDPLQLHPEAFIDPGDDPQCLSQPV